MSNFSFPSRISKKPNRFNNNRQTRTVNNVIRTDLISRDFQKKNTRGGFSRNNRGRGMQESKFQTEFSTTREKMERRRLQDPEWVEAATKVITKRFNYGSLYLNLENLSTDPDLMRSAISMNICAQGDIGAIFKIIMNTTNNLNALNLAGNSISNMGSIIHFLRKFPNITRLNLENNNIDSVSQIRKLGYLKLEELIFRNNPLLDILKVDYVRTFRNIFPTLTRLDDFQLCPDVKFAVVESVVLPESRDTCCSNMQLGQIVANFVLQYFSFLDSGKVDQLAYAYHEEAILTLSANTLRCKGKMPDEYRSNSRNLKFFAPDDQRKNKVTFCGRNEIVQLLRGLPPSNHKAVTFDLNVDEPSYAVFTVTGNVYDINRALNFLFVRTYCVVPNPAGGILILNEQITISKSQLKNTAPVLPMVQNLSQQQIDMVIEFSRKTGMIEKYSYDCLNENGWNFVKAATDFNNLNANNRIPRDAFRL